MLSKKMLDALNTQIDKEFYSSYLYLSMSAYFEDKNLGGMAQWMRVQSSEEKGHAMKIFEYVVRQDGRIALGAIPKPKADWKSPHAAFTDAYKHEQLISKSIDELVDLARAENDKATEAFLLWFVTEQVEEENTAKHAKDKLEMAGENVGALFVLDREFGARAAR